ncbi:MAG: aldehyde dehydrogenase family protein [Pseudomonadota bacterium]
MDYKLYFDGRWQGASSSFEVFNPVDRSVFARVANAGVEEARQAISAANEASPAWAASSIDERAAVLRRVADLLDERQKDIAKILVAEAGSWIGKAMAESGNASPKFRTAVEVGRHYPLGAHEVAAAGGKTNIVERRPLGVVAVISPWNFPLTLSSRGVATPLMAGNTVVLKPSEETPVSGGLILAELFDEAGAPPGVFNVITCARDSVAAVGDELIENPHVKAIDFTGSTAVGRHIGAKAGALFKRVCLELGGKDALIVLDDADLETAVSAATFASFMHQGQICMSAERIVVHEAIADEFTRRFAENVRSLGYGDPTQKDKAIGPIINRKQMENIEAQVQDARSRGAAILTGGESDGPYYQPTVIADVTRDMKVFRDETFGPVAAVIKVADDDEAVDVANDCEYGLSAGVITNDSERGLAVARRLETGMAHVNDGPLNDNPALPFGGCKSSGIGRHGGEQGFDMYTETRWLSVQEEPRPYPPAFAEKR